MIQLVPVSAKPGRSGFTLTVYGANFVAGSVLKWNGSPRATQVMSSDQLTATINAQDVSKASTASVTVVNPAPGGGVSNVAYFSVQSASTTIALAPDPQILKPGLVAVADF
ncbi:MAG: IPT/TIG domain-containing protein, partial [Terriglobales bacterium]